MGDSFSRQYINRGYVSFESCEVRNAREVAEVMQVFRDPRFETFRIVYVKDGKIVATEGVSSRLPSSAPHKKRYQTDEARIKEVADRKKKLGADGYYLVHNHPTGDVTPSAGDASISLLYKENIDGYKGHVIIDHNEYGVVDADGIKIIETNGISEGNFGSKHVLSATPKADLLKTASVEHPLLWKTLKNNEAVCQAMKSLEDEGSVTTLLFRDKKGRITGIESISNSLSHNGKGFDNFLRKRATHYGAETVTIGTSDPVVASLSKKYIKNKSIDDCFFLGKKQSYSVREKDGIVPSEWLLYTRMRGRKQGGI